MQIKLVIREILTSAGELDISSRHVMLILNFIVFRKIIKNINLSNAAGDGCRRSDGCRRNAIFRTRGR